MIQLRAASRLIAVAAADEAMARAFLKSVAGIEVGKLTHSVPGAISFSIDGPQAFMTARKHLTERYGKMDQSMTTYGSHAGRWFLDDAKTKIIALSDAKYGGGIQKDPYSLSLLDTTHKETTSEMLRRHLGPPRSVPMK